MSETSHVKTAIAEGGVVPPVDSERVVIQSGETLEELQAIVNAEFAFFNTHWSRLEQ